MMIQCKLECHDNEVTSVLAFAANNKMSIDSIEHKADNKSITIRGRIFVPENIYERAIYPDET